MYKRSMAFVDSLDLLWYDSTYGQGNLTKYVNSLKVKDTNYVVGCYLNS